jgi:hypothetical protein
LAGVLALLVAIGFAISIRVPMQMNNYVLVGLYATYIVGSIALVAIGHHRS